MFADTGEEFRVYTNTEGTNEDLSIQQSDQNPHHWCQQGPLDHGREKVPAGRHKLPLFILTFSTASNTLACHSLLLQPPPPSTNIAMCQQHLQKRYIHKYTTVFISMYFAIVANVANCHFAKFGPMNPGAVQCSKIHLRSSLMNMFV